MTDTQFATVRINHVKKGPQALVYYTTRKGQQSWVLSAGNISPSLEMLFRQSPAKLDGLEVEFEVFEGRVSNVRPKGEAPRQQESPRQPANTASGGGRNDAGRNAGRGPDRRGGGGFDNHRQGRNNIRNEGANRRKFENPYNYIPAPPRDTGHPRLGDAPPLGHHRYHGEGWSGTIAVSMTTATPLLIADGGLTQVEDTGDAKKGHKYIGIRKHLDGSPCIPPVAVKGMLRAAFEAVTNSRMGVLDRHDVPLAFRRDAREGVQVVPALVVDGGNAIQLLPGTGTIGDDGKPVGLLTYGAWLPRYGAARHYLQFGSNHIKHRAQVWAELEYWKREIYNQRDQCWKDNFDFWRVVGLKSGDAPRPTTFTSHTAAPQRGQPPQVRKYSYPDAGKPHIWVRGWVFESGQNMSGKHDERVFFVADGHPQAGLLKLKLEDVHKAGWCHLIKNYQDEHERDIKNGITRPSALPNYCRFSRHINPGPGDAARQRERELRDGDLLYAAVKRHGSGFELVSLAPVMIPRELFKLAPRSLVEKNLLPATAPGELSPADRVFGWMGGKAGQHKGQLRVTPVACRQGEAAVEKLEPGVTLAILGGAKAGQFRFNVGDKDGSPLATVAKSEGYSNAESQGLRGRRVYPTQRQAVLPGYFQANANSDESAGRVNGQNVYREYLMKEEALQQGAADIVRNDMNRTLVEWIKPGMEFHFDIQIDNLSEEEVGALLWLLQLNPPTEKDDAADKSFHHLGGGKPFGFGCVELSLRGVNLRRGDTIRADYLAFGEPRTGPDDGTNNRMDSVAACGPLIDAYQRALETFTGHGVGSFACIPLVQAFLNAAKPGKLPVHYPRNTQQPGGKIYEWFVANEKPNNRRPLPFLADDDRGLEYY